MEVRKRTIFQAIFCGDIPLHRPKNMVGTSNKSVPKIPIDSLTQGLFNIRGMGW